MRDTHHHRALLPIVVAALLCLSLVQTAFAQRSGPVAPRAGWPEAYFDDAELADVCFVDAYQGWAVGDRGAIWHTIDGGRNWTRQNGGVDCRLASVSFIDNIRGWAVGRTTVPLSHRSRGIVLVTDDAGEHWRRVPDDTLPGLVRVKMFPDGSGWALGDSTPFYPSGVFTTRDGGRSWQPMPGASRGWLTGDFSSPRVGVIAGSAGQLSVVGEGRFEDTRTPPLGDRAIHALRLGDRQQGWLVGEGGLILTTADGGVSWQTTAGQPPRELTEHFDWQAVATQGEAVWIAGSPGSRILHSPDGGHTWQPQATGQTAPLKAIFFADAQHGWAVGSLGVVLATSDGGQTWQPQRGGGRVALLAIVSEPGNLPLELIADAAADGYKTAAMVLNRRDVEVPEREGTALPARLHAAVIGAGGSCGLVENQFPLRQPGLEQTPEDVLGAWDRAHDAQALTALDETLVAAIRTWRPEVIVTHPPTASDATSLDLFISQRVAAAVGQAAEPTALPELATAAGLPPWQVKRVYGLAGASGVGDMQITGSRPIPHLACSVSDLAERGTPLLFAELPAPHETLGLFTLQDRSGLEHTPVHLFDGLRLPPASEARRAETPPMAFDFDALTRQTQQQRNALRLVTTLEASPHGGQAWLAQIGDLTQNLPEQAAGEVLDQLAVELHASGHTDLADEVLAVLVEQNPRHALWQAATIDLVRHQASSEIGWRLERQGTAVVQSPRQRAERALALGKMATDRDPLLLAEPLLQFPLSAAARQNSLPAQANRFYSIVATSEGHAWQQAAAGEMWLTNSDDIPPRSIWRCVPAAQPPHLDGQLDDPLWRSVPVTPLTSALGDDGEWPAAARLAYDDEYLYFALECRQAPGADYTPDDTSVPRTHDADLAARDRVTLLLDTDRDYATWWSLTSDDRGWPAESLDGDTHWDPKWFIAAETEDGVWRVEAAIPLAELAARPPTAGEVWNVGLQRVVPQVGFQSWSRPAAIEARPQGFGFLVFQ